MCAKVALVHREDWPYPDWVGEELTAAGINFVRRDCESEAELLELAADAEIVWVFGGARLITPQSILGLTACGAILRSGAGTDRAVANGARPAEAEDAEDAAVVEVDDIELLALGSSRRSSVEGDDDNSCVHLQAVVKWSTWGSKLDQWTVHYVD